MNISIPKEFIERNRFSILFAILLIFISIIITYFKILIQIDIGPPWDTFDFLADAMYFAGMDFGYVDLIRPPLIPFLTSLFFRAGFVSEVIIFLLDGILFIFGVLGFYLFLKLRFNTFQSFLGSLFFISFPVVLLWIGAGYTDIASTSFSIWALYLTVLAVKRNPKYFYLSFPLAALAFLTRFPSAIIIFPMFIYLLINRDSIKDFKILIGGIIASILIISLAFLFFFHVLKDPFFPFLNAYGSSLGGYATEKFALNYDPFYYITNSVYGFINLNLLNNNSLTDLISFTVFFILIICSTIGIIIFSFQIFRFKNGLKDIKKFILDKSKLIFGLILLSFIFIVTLNHVNYLISDTLFFFIIFLFYNLLKERNLDNLDLDLLFITWLASFLIVSSVFEVKVYRYFIPMAPAVAYFIILGWSEFSAKINLKLKKLPVNSILCGLFVFALLFSSLSFLYQLENDPLAHGNNFKIHPEKQSQKFVITGKPNTGYLYFETNNKQELKKVTSWLEDYDPAYKNKTIYSDYFWPQFSWELKTFVKGIIDQKYKDTNYELTNLGADYYINIQYEVNLPGYIKIKEFNTSFGVINVYKRI